MGPPCSWRRVPLTKVESPSKGSHSNSTESEGPCQQPSINPLRSPTSQALGPDSNSLVFRNEPMIPNSPPPSYEFVLEELKSQTRMEQIAEREREGKGQEAEKEIKEKDKGDEAANKQQQVSRSVRSAGGSSQGLCVPKGGKRQPVKDPKIFYKSSKELYRAFAKQRGITCKMSDYCRCFDCQSHYFDCEYEKDEQEQTDGGLGAGTPMFISEVIHGTACVLL